jgi:CBS domain-containing protein
MKVKEIMSANPTVCTLTDNLATAAGLMWENDCGIIPVVAEGGKVVGLITDRDICMAAALNDRNLSNIAVQDVITGEVVSCATEDDVKTALSKMQDNKVHRLAVVTDTGTLEGVLSMNDLVLQAEDPKSKKVEISFADIVNAYKAICEHRSTEAKAIGASA